jgi:hypothetical protein
MGLPHSPTTVAYHTYLFIYLCSILFMYVIVQLFTQIKMKRKNKKEKCRPSQKNRYLNILRKSKNISL